MKDKVINSEKLNIQSGKTIRSTYEDFFISKCKLAPRTEQLRKEEISNFSIKLLGVPVPPKPRLSIIW